MFLVSRPNVTPVSYTHLDVYKRQGGRRTRGMSRSLPCSGGIAVSRCTCSLKHTFFVLNQCYKSSQNIFKRKISEIDCLVLIAKYSNKILKEKLTLI